MSGDMHEDTVNLYALTSSPSSSTSRTHANKDANIQEPKKKTEF